MNLKCDAIDSIESRENTDTCQSVRDGFAVGDTVRWVDGFIDVCCLVELEMSPISASAPVLKIPIAQPEINSKAMKNAT